jgi:hypothetical protein
MPYLTKAAALTLKLAIYMLEPGYTESLIRNLRSNLQLHYACWVTFGFSISLCSSSSLLREKYVLFDLHIKKNYPSMAWPFKSSQGFHSVFSVMVKTNSFQNIYQDQDCDDT